MNFVDIDIEKYEGVLAGDLIIYEKGEDPDDGFVLYGFDEVGMFDHQFKNAQYAICEYN